VPLNVKGENHCHRTKVYYISSIGSGRLIPLCKSEQMQYCTANVGRREHVCRSDFRDTIPDTRGARRCKSIHAGTSYLLFPTSPHFHDPLHQRHSPHLHQPCPPSSLHSPLSHVPPHQVCPPTTVLQLILMIASTSLPALGKSVLSPQLPHTWSSRTTVNSCEFYPILGQAAAPVESRLLLQRISHLLDLSTSARTRPRRTPLISSHPRPGWFPPPRVQPRKRCA
jgi:hypothetical protein